MIESVEARCRELASAVRRLRVAATSDPGRAEELADALVALTAARLLAGDPAEAAADAPDSVVQAARILAARGPSGPYASLPDAVRYASATAQLAAVQAGLGQAAAAGRTLDGLDAWRAQLGRLPVAEHLPDPVAVWTLLSRAQSLLDAEPAQANGWADAAEVRLHGSSAPPPYLALATHLVVADCRWAAGRPESALAHHRLALDVHRAAIGALGERPRPGVAKVALAPVAAVYETYAARLAATGDASGGLALRREALTLLESWGDADAAGPARSGLAAALADVGRASEAAELDGPAVGSPRASSPPSPSAARLVWDALPAALALPPADPAGATVRWQQAEQAALFAGVAARADAERTESALQAAAESAAARRAAAAAESGRRAAEAAAAAQAERAAQADREAALAAERAGREEAAARLAAEERRTRLAAEHRRDVDPELASAAAAALDDARAAVRTAGDEPAALVAATEQLAELLRPLAAADPVHEDELAATLEVLVGLRWRLGDADGSRAAAREAKALRG